MNEKAHEHLTEICNAEENVTVFSLLNGKDKSMLAGLSDRDMELFITDRKSRWCVLAGGYIYED